MGQRDFEILQRHIAASLVEQHSGEGCAHFEAGKTGGKGGVFASLEDHRANTAAGPGWMDKKGANLGGFMLRVKQCGLAARPLVAAIERFSFAPTAAAYDQRGDGIGCACGSPAPTLDSSATK